MANISKSGKEWSRKQHTLFLKLFQGLCCRLTWRDALVGFLAAIALTVILAGFRQQILPEFVLDQIADRDIQASKDVTYIDEEATAKKRSEARDKIPAIFELDREGIASTKESISAAFRNARTFLENEGITEKTPISSSKEKELLASLSERVGSVLSKEILPVLLRKRFDPAIEENILKVLNTVLLEGIIEDRSRFQQLHQKGIIIRDSSFPYEHTLTNANLVRDLTDARPHLGKLDLNLQDWSAQEKNTMVQYLESMLFPSLVYNSVETENRRKLAAAQAGTVEVQIKRGQTVVRHGERISRLQLQQLNALKNLWKPTSKILRGTGFFIFIAILLYAMWRYMVYYKSGNRKLRSHATLILVIIMSEMVIVRLATALADILDERFQRFDDPYTLYYAIPFAIGPLLAALLIDINLGATTTIILATLIGLFYGDVNLAVYLVMGSFAGIYSIRQYKDRAAILKAGFAIGIMNCICFTGLFLLQQNSITLAAGIDFAAVAFISGILASTIASMMLPALEYFFKIVTDIRLLELSNLNDPILRRLSVEAPGTYHHSLMVATLAEDAAEAIGANPLLTRVSAYYHDIGKILKPEYFVENQSMDYNKHEEIAPRISSLVLASHVKDGLQLAREIGLPQSIREMIPQHHGTRMMSYFFRKAKDSITGKSGKVSDADFRYSGPKPQSREAAIMMMADSVEAASRTLTDPNPSQIKGMIERLVDGIVSDEQFEECDITLKDIRLVKQSFFKILTGIFHRRIDYPDYDFKKNSSRAGNTAVQGTGTKQTKTV